MGFGGLTTLWGGREFLMQPQSLSSDYALSAALAIAAALTAGYTAWLFGQARGRPLWMRRGLFFELLLHAILAGACLWLLVHRFGFLNPIHWNLLRWTAVGGLAIRLLMLPLEHLQAPSGRKPEYLRVLALLLRGPLARRRWVGSIAVGTVLPLVLFLLPHPNLWTIGALLGLYGLWVEVDTFVQAGQALPIS